MGFKSTNKCFFTGQDVIRNQEIDETLLDGYYYAISFNGKIREIRLWHVDDWEKDIWIKQNGADFIRLLDKWDLWNFFNLGKTLSQVKDYYYERLKIESLA